jgi:hypothetical protein
VLSARNCDTPERPPQGSAKVTISGKIGGLSLLLASKEDRGERESERERERERERGRDRDRDIGRERGQRRETREKRK